mgnify:CR=1 FL=1
MKRKTVKKIITILAGLLVIIIFFMPVCWIFATSLRLPKDSFKWPPLFFPTSFHISNYIEVIKRVPFLMFILNSLKVAAVVMVGQCIIDTMMAYAFARIEFKGREALFILVLAGLMVPPQASIIPLFMIVRNLNAMNSHISLVLPALMSPLSVFMIRQSMMTIDKSYDEAAELDGASHWMILLKVIVPMCKPSIALVAIMSFLNSWNDYFRALIFISNYNKMTIPVGIQMLKGFMGGGSVSIILAGVMMSMVPPMIIFILGQKYIMKGIRIGGMKG